MGTGSNARIPPVEPPAATSDRRRWTLTQEAFEAFLARLGPDRNSAGEKYLEIRRSLTRFFEWRGCPFPEDHADETINRVAKRVFEGEELRSLAGYFLGAARMLLLEIHKERAKEQKALGDPALAAQPSREFEELEPRVTCLQRCLAALPATNRELILQYYQGEGGAKIQNRKKLTERLKVPINTLRMRALRLREGLQSCVEDCLQT